MSLELYPHQCAGVSWLSERDVALLADEQGLGKTITALVAAEGFDRILVVAPTVVAWNWKREAETWLDARCVQVITDGKCSVYPPAQVVVVTHGLLIRPAILEQLAAMEWDVCIVDEAHAFKSPDAQRTRALYSHVTPRCRRVWLLTGTPMPNDASELWTHLRALAPERLHTESGSVASYREFIDRFCVWHLAKRGRNRFPKITGNKPARLADLRRRLDGFVLRRLKSDELDLPPIRFETVHLRPPSLSDAFEAMNLELAPDLEGIGDADELFGKLRGSAWPKFRRLCGLAKAGQVAEMLHAELASGALRKVVVFAHHTDVVARVAQELSEFGVHTITGATPAKDRQRYVDEFQAADGGVRVMVCNIVAGGVGVTLTAAADVVFAEQSWVPGENAQAADRCHRIGQTKRVRVRFATLAGTIDETITGVLIRKTRMIAEVLG